MTVLTDEVWESLVKSLPTGDYRQFQKTITAVAEEYARRNFPDSYMAEREALKAKNRAVANAARALLEHYDGGMAWRAGMNWTTDWERYDAFLAQLREIAEDAEANLKRLSRKAPVSTRPRDVLLRMAVEGWRRHGGKVGSSTHYSSGKPGGPLVRYLITVSQAAGIKLTAGQARGFIRKLNGETFPP